MGKRKKQRKKARDRNRKKSGITLSKMEISASEHPAFQNAMRKLATANVEAFPNLFELVQEQFRRFEPLGIMSSFARYAFAATSDESGAEQNAMWVDIHQHHVELLQAVLLSVPEQDWGQKPHTAQCIQVLFENVPKLSNTFFFQRTIEALDTPSGGQDAVVESLQMRIRMHTQVIRNWGYFSDVPVFATELYSPLDTKFLARHGFSISDLIETMQSLIAAFEQHFDEHFGAIHKAVSKLLSAGSVEDAIEYCLKSLPYTGWQADELRAALPAGAWREGLVSYAISALDIRSAEQATFDVDSVAVLSSRSHETVERILKALSVPPGKFVDFNPQHLFLGNPVWTAPGIDLGDRFFFPMPHMAFSHIHPVIFRLCEQASLKKDIEELRSSFLERKLGEALRKALPSARIRPNVHWRASGVAYETDQLVILDRIVLIAEAKSQRLTPEGLRGAPKRVKKHVQELVLHPSLQSQRLESLILAAQEGDAAAGKTVHKLGIDPARIDRIIRLSVTLDDLSVLSAEEEKLKEIEWVPSDHELAPTITIADLTYLVDILENPILFLHYLYERGFIQKALNVFGDELDFLGIYLENGFNMAGIEDQIKSLAATGMSAAMDEYYMARDRGLSLPKPKAKLAPFFQSIVEQLCDAKPPGWIMVGLHLLSAGDYSEQLEVEEEIKKLRQAARKRYRDPACQDYFPHIAFVPKKHRKALVAFYLYSNELRSGLRANMENVARTVLASHHSEECCLIAKNIDNWEAPSETALLLCKQPSST